MFSFGWGNPICVKEALIKQFPFFESVDLNKMNYPLHEGNYELISKVRELISLTVGKQYEHVLITNGATQGLVTALNSIKTTHYGADTVSTNPVYFSFYPGIIDSQGLHHLTQSFCGDIIIVDSPSNPTGLILPYSFSEPTIWDSAYHSRTYGTTSLTEGPRHDILVGSLSKLLGLPGLRVGWAATDSDRYYKNMLSNTTYTLCGVSAASQNLALDVVKKLDFDTFFIDSKRAVDYNKEEFLRLKPIFGQELPEYGMFAFWQIDKSLKKLLSDSNVAYTCGSTVGKDEGWARLSLGQNNLLTKQMIDTVLKKDTI